MAKIKERRGPYSEELLGELVGSGLSVGLDVSLVSLGGLVGSLRRDNARGRS